MAWHICRAALFGEFSLPFFSLHPVWWMSWVVVEVVEHLQQLLRRPISMEVILMRNWVEKTRVSWKRTGEILVHVGETRRGRRRRRRRGGRVCEREDTVSWFRHYYYVITVSCRGRASWDLPLPESNQLLLWYCTYMHNTQTKLVISLLLNSTPLHWLSVLWIIKW